MQTCSSTYCRIAFCLFCITGPFLACFPTLRRHPQSPPPACAVPFWGEMLQVKSYIVNKALINLMFFHLDMKW